MDQLHVSADTYRKQETFRFDNAAQTHGVIFYRALNLLLIPAIALLTNGKIDDTVSFIFVAALAFAINVAHLVFHLFGIKKFSHWSYVVPIDALLYLLLADFTGDYTSGYRYLFVLLILYSITHFDRRITYITGTIALGFTIVLYALSILKGNTFPTSELAFPTILVAISVACGEIAVFIKGMRRSAVDAVLAQIEAKRLVVAQNDNLEKIVAERTAALERANEQLEQLSLHDPLVKIPNRRFFDRQFDIEWRRAQREKSSLSLFMIDIDHFKQFNDHYGHAQGDACLRVVASAIQSELRRAGDFVARFGGEEFVVILPRTELAGATVIAERLCNAISALKIAHEKSPTSQFVSISIGIAVIENIENNTALSLLGQADKALYRAKRNGRNRYEAA